MAYTGELAAITTAVLWSFTSIFFTEAAKRTGSVQLNINRLIMASVLLLSTILIGGFEYRLTGYQVFNLVISGFLGLVLGDAFLFKSYLLIGPRFAILLMALSPGMSSVLSYLFLGESLTPVAIAGVLITVTGIAIAGSEKKMKDDAKYKLSAKGLLY
ncbi:MAG: DMT family transporter, partial [Ignavibacteriales bacterium]|nr:DMT family transporter [Ignavibacteriales bacterium]